MKNILLILIIALFPELNNAEEKKVFIEVTNETDLKNYEWTNRPLAVFANSSNDVNFQRQIKMLKNNILELKERDIVVLVDTDPNKNTPLRQQLRPRGFALLLIGKDGQIKLRKPFPWNVREISRVIDKMPMRRQEINGND